MTELPDPRGPSYRLPSPPPPDPTGWHELRRRTLSTLWPPRSVAWAGLLARAVFVVDKAGTLRYMQLVKEVANEPNYVEVLKAVAPLI